MLLYRIQNIHPLRYHVTPLRPERRNIIGRSMLREFAVPGRTEKLAGLGVFANNIKMNLNTLRTGNANLRFYIKTAQDG